MYQAITHLFIFKSVYVLLFIKHKEVHDMVYAAK